MSRTIEKTVYTFDELSDDAKETARAWWRDCENADFDTDYDDFEAVATILGITFRQKPVPLMGGGTRYDPAIYWSGFSSQGDGACFEGSYAYAKGATKAIREYAPKDSELHRIADTLRSVQRPHFYRLVAGMEHRGPYQHSGCMSVDVEHADDTYRSIGAADDDIKQAMRDFADWMYRQLEREYEWRMTDENVDESIRVNEYEFDENGCII